MSLWLLFKDELKGFYKSNVMIILWIGLPLLSVIFYLFMPNPDNQASISFITSGIISSFGGWLAAMMLAIQIIHEESHHVYDLFLIRPVRRSQIILSKYLAVFFCVALACILALFLSFFADYFFINKYSSALVLETIKSLVISLAIISIECAAGAFVGVMVSSVIVGVILVVVTHNISSLTIIMPLMTKPHYPLLYPVVVGISLSVVFLFLSIEMFKRKQF
ncbi:ABC-2 transporter permease [candidate division KSB1 bacterium]|nr:ABC-2 transporter permease [candidate division KSB1 bacterium]MBL7093895.1 ABC-2 transporter permease [candidate division KSB1 bacterium]